MQNNCLRVEPMIKPSAKDRLEKVVCWAGLNTAAFATHIGLSSPQTLYQIKSGKHNISRSLAERICAHYPELDFAWLFAGEGEMVRPLEASIPYYLVDCTEVALGNTPALPHGRVNMMGCGDCAFAAPLNAATMEPEISRGSVLFLREIALEDVQVGQTLLVATAKMASVRKVADLSPTHIRLEGGEQSRVAPLTLDPTQIRRLLVVKAALEWKHI